MLVKGKFKNFTGVGAEEWIDDSIVFLCRETIKVSLANKPIININN
jgi:hypothetical protein